MHALRDESEERAISAMWSHVVVRILPACSVSRRDSIKMQPVPFGGHRDFTGFSSDGHLCATDQFTEKRGRTGTIRRTTRTMRPPRRSSMTSPPKQDAFAAVPAHAGVRILPACSVSMRHGVSMLPVLLALSLSLLPPLSRSRSLSLSSLSLSLSVCLFLSLSGMRAQFYICIPIYAVISLSLSQCLCVSLSVCDDIHVATQLICVLYICCVCLSVCLSTHCKQKMKTFDMQTKQIW